MKTRVGWTLGLAVLAIGGVLFFARTGEKPDVRPRASRPLPPTKDEEARPGEIGRRAASGKLERRSEDLSPPEEVLRDAVALQQWLLAISDETLRALLGTKKLDGYVRTILCALGDGEEVSGHGKTGAFLDALNARIRAVNRR